MAFPVRETTATTNGTTATTTPVVNLPSGILPGNLLCVVIRVAVAGTITFPAGWTDLFNSSADASDDQTAFLWKVADGTDGTTVTLGSGNGKFAAVAYRIRGGDVSGMFPVERSAAATGTDAAPDPPSLAPAGGAKDYLFLWVGGWEGEQTSPPAGNPTNYSNPIGANSGTAGAITTNCRVASAERPLNAASENPPSWTISVSDDWSAWTIAIHPSAMPFLVTAHHQPEPREIYG